MTQKTIKEITDKERLDWLEWQSNGTPWVARRSAIGRGFRLHNTGGDEHWPFESKTAREAIDNAMRAMRAERGE